MGWLMLAVACAGCEAPSHAAVTQLWSLPAGRAKAECRPATTESITEWICPEAVWRIEHGIERGLVCPAEVRERGLAIIDLSDAWTPKLFAPTADGTTPDFRATYLALAAEHDEAGRPIEGAEALGELYGVVPSLAIVRERLTDEARHACHASIDSSPIALLDKPYAEDFGPVVKRANQQRAWLASLLERERVKRKLPDLAALTGVARLAGLHRRWKRLDDQHRGIVAAQRHLVCEGVLAAKDADGSISWRTSNAVELFQRRNFLMPNQRLDPETRVALMTDSRELDFRLALRILRERVVDASGLIEDGSAGDGPRAILGRMLDPAAMSTVRGHTEPLVNAAPDLVGPATEAVARQLGWTGPAEVKAFLARHPEGLRVAISLPQVPAYHGPHMALFAEIDRGDVWYDAVPQARRVSRRPTLVLYVDDHGTKRPLIRWPTTIGGWSDVRTDAGWIHKRWKESDVGPRVWRNLYAAPTWLPPPTTPDRDLVRNLYNGRWELDRAVMGPGPRAAFGMMLLVHDKVWRQRDGTQKFWSNGIGTHGSSSVTSIVNGTSHGCHRLYNQLAVRLADFLLRHRGHVVKGQQQVHYRRTIRHKGTFVANITTRGFLYELSPPVPVEVRKGTIKSKRKLPPTSAAWASRR